MMDEGPRGEWNGRNPPSLCNFWGSAPCCDFRLVRIVVHFPFMYYCPHSLYAKFLSGTEHTRTDNFNFGVRLMIIRHDNMKIYMIKTVKVAKSRDDGVYDRNLYPRTQRPEIWGGNLLGTILFCGHETEINYNSMHACTITPQNPPGT
jgi:hypothetical protein